MIPSAGIIISHLLSIHFHCILYAITGPNFHCYVSFLPASARPHLELQLDFGHGGVEKDLYEIASHMLNWEEISALLGLTVTDISDTKDMYPNKPALQR